MVDGDDLADVAGAGDGVGIDAGDLVGGALDEVVHRVGGFVQVEVQFNPIIVPFKNNKVFCFIVIKCVVDSILQICHRIAHRDDISAVSKLLGGKLIRPNVIPVCILEKYVNIHHDGLAVDNTVAPLSGKRNRTALSVGSIKNILDVQHGAWLIGLIAKFPAKEHLTGVGLRSIADN